jgi:hypothetical protein
LELLIKSYLLRPDFASVDFWGEDWLHLDPTPWTLPSIDKGTASVREGTKLRALGRLGVWDKDTGDMAERGHRKEH